MDKRELIFKPKKKAPFKRSPLYIFSMFGKSFLICCEYLIQASRSTFDRATTDAYIERFWRFHFEVARATLYATGREHLKKDETYVFMSNHGSWMDIPAMFATVPSSLRMVSKVELMKLPVIGHAMLNGGFIAIDRKNRNKAIRQLEHAKERLKTGISIWIAPEGTRSRNGSLAPFKKGGFHLARDLGMAIVPVYIEGAREVMPADSMWIYPNKSITVHFCEPIMTTSFDRSTTTDLMNKVREAILQKHRECEDRQSELEAKDDTL
jgi:1-acyl-sn-glycerol-3-phosphate acyltransferase